MTAYRFQVDTADDLSEKTMKNIQRTLAGVFGVQAVELECSHKQGAVCELCDEFGK